MGIFKVNPEDISSFSVRINPDCYYASSSSGVTGSKYVFSRRSKNVKDVSVQGVTTYHSDDSTYSFINSLSRTGFVTRNASGSISSSFYSLVDEYLTKVNSLPESTKHSKQIYVERFVPGVSYDDTQAKKNVIRNILQRHYRFKYPTSRWGYTNYNSLNFFTASSVPSSATILYPNTTGSYEHSGYVTGTYNLSGAFTFDFHINPRYTTDANNGVYKAGTIFHLSSSYAVSLISGSSKDENGKPDAFRLVLQLSHSADIKPSLAVTGSYPNNLVFVSDDNSLLLNSWHHVSIRWGTNAINNGTGSFFIDGEEAGDFVIPSGTVNLGIPSTVGRPDVLCIGNYYEGVNSGLSAQALFFAADPALRDGLEELVATTSVDQPASFTFNHQLNAEVHDLSIRSKYVSDRDYENLDSTRPSTLTSDYLFYVPPFFTRESPTRQYVNTHGGVLVTPFLEANGTTDDPFNVSVSFSVGGHFINLENFTKDFATNQFPRLINLTASILANTTTARVANEFLYDQAPIRLRNLMILPCDDGTYKPTFNLLLSESLSGSFIDEIGYEDLTYVKLHSLLTQSSLVLPPLEQDDDRTTHSEFSKNLINFTPEQPGLTPGSAVSAYKTYVNNLVSADTYEPGDGSGFPLTIYQRTRDDSSNQVVIFDISNIFFGKSIKPGTVELLSGPMSGSGGAVSITLRDDGLGSLYRADCVTSQSVFTNVGNVYYDEGVVVIKSPHLYFFGKDSYELSFKGDHGLHVLTVEAFAPSDKLNSSSNASWSLLSASLNANDSNNNGYVNISMVNFHDENYNVIMKTQLAQPIMKRFGSKLLVKTKMDF